MKNSIIAISRIALTLLLAGKVSGVNAQDNMDFRNPNLEISERVEDLLSRLSFEEKVSQLVYNSPAIERLDIPAYNWWNEALHGVARNGIATVFPQAIGMAATWDRELMYRISTIISDEARAKYNQAISRDKHGIYQGLSLWSPNINIFRDPRWGRGMETYGEDPYLTGEMAVQFIKGLQGDDPKYLKTIATPKHLAVHSGPEPDRHTFNAIVNEYDLRETYLPHFKKSIIEGKAYSVMCGYNRLRGDACCGSNPLLKEILRYEWGFDGLVVSDCWAVPDIYNFHKIVDTPEEAAAMAVKAGTDLECGNSYPSLIKAEKDGLITEDEIDVAVRRVLEARFKLGMFDPADMVPYSNLTEIDTDENKATALESVHKSIVLLKNENSFLPLDKDVKKIAVLGPNADNVEVLLGNYNGFPSNPVTVYQGIKKKLPEAEVVYERGCELAEGIPSFTVIPDKYFYTDNTLTKNGLKAEYFDNHEWNGEAVHERIDNNIDCAWWDQAPYPEFDPDNYGVVWSGVLVPTVSGKYALGGYGFNGFRIYLEDSLLVKFDGEFEPVKIYEYVELEAGKSYPIKVEFYKNLRYSLMQLIWDMPDETLESRALSAAEDADVVVLAMGLSPRLEGEEMRIDVEGFKGGDRLSLNLPATQSEFIKKIYSVNKNVVLVLINGSAVAVNWEDEHLPSIVEAWYPGQAAGTAIADILFGDCNPSGRLPVTFYKSVDQLPDFSDYNMSNRTYRYFKGEPLYPFGYGLSYSTFVYTNPQLDKKEIKADESAVFSVDVTNKSELPGEEVVQLYINADKDAKSVRTLKGFSRIFLNAGETQTVKFRIADEELSRWTEEQGFSVKSDSYTIMVGSSSAKTNLVSKVLKVVTKQ